MLDLSNLHGSIRRMHHVVRFSSLPTIRQENVAAHSWEVAFISYLIAHDLNARLFPVDVGRVLIKAVTHDVSECMSGDVIRSYKYGTDAMIRATREADSINVRALSEELGSERTWWDWTESKDDSLAGRVVAFGDYVCVVTKCVEEHRMGNTMLDQIVEGVYRTLLQPLRDDDRFGVYVRQLFPLDDYTSAYMEPGESWRNISSAR